MTGEPGSFAHLTMVTRFPAIIQTVLVDHAGQYPDSIVQSLQALYDELVQNQPVRPLETAASDGADWAEAWKPFQGRGWLDIPWYFAETFFFRRLLEATGYFGGGEEAKLWAGVDPFLSRKQAELQSKIPWEVLAAALRHAPDDAPDSFRALLHHCVWGNRIDLSHPQLAQASGKQIAVTSEQANLLVDDTETVLAHLKTRGHEEKRTRGEEEMGMQREFVLPPHRLVQFICDNAGTELLMDLALVDFLLRFDWVERITLHVKAHPTYVSDTTPADITMTIAAIKAPAAPEFVALAARLESYQQQQRLFIQPDIFWNSSHFFWEIPPALRAELSQADLVIIKGDANYRRLLGDSRWPASAPIEAVVPYFPAPFVALRTMKSDPVVGLPLGLAEQLDREDAEWRVNGKRGIIQALLRKQ
jgi:uncharacterized protein with ATP-grasp and redox domains